MAHTLFVPLMLTLGAGLATGIGSTIALFAHRTNKRLLSFSLGLSGGVMIYVSFVELFQQAREAIGAIYGPQTGMGITTLAFFGGVLLIGVIDRLVPSVENPHEAHMIEELEKKPKNAKLMRMGLMTALAIGIHNFPEGIATFATAVENPTLGIAIAVAIAIHNIPEGIAVSIPVFYATGDRMKAFRYSLLSGLAEPVGALLAYFILMPFMSPVMMGCILAGVAGIMVFISIDELLPRIRRSPHLDLRRDERHGDHGPQPDPARIKHATRLYINVPLRKHSTPNPLREKDAGKGRIINAATSLRINVPSDSTLQPSNKGPRKIYLNQYTALRSESDRQCSDVSRALPRKKFRVNPASNNGPQNCGYRRIQKKRSHIIP